MNKHDDVTEKQLESAKKSIEWMELSKPSVAAREIGLDISERDDACPAGKAVRPHDRDCGRAHPIEGANSEDLREWCGEHQL